MSLTEALLAGRRAIEALMTDTCDIGRPDPNTPPVLDEATLEYITTNKAVYSGRCRLQARNVQGSEQDAGETLTIVSRVVLSLPANTAGIVSGDLVTITASPFNPQIVGAHYRVRSVMDKSHPTAVRLECEEA